MDRRKYRRESDHTTPVRLPDTDREADILIEDIFGDPLNPRLPVENKRSWKAIARRKSGSWVELDTEVLNEFRHTGRGWEERINIALKEWLKSNDPMGLPIKQHRRIVIERSSG